MPNEMKIVQRWPVQSKSRIPSTARAGAFVRLVEGGGGAMTPSEAPKGELVLFQTDDGRTRIECRFKGDTIWLTQLQLAELIERLRLIEKGMLR